MQPIIKILTEKTLVGKSLPMSLMADKTMLLWQSFMPRRKEINSLSTDLFSVRVYDQPDDIRSPEKEFRKWAALEVDKNQDTPLGMEKLVLPSGLYAVFHYIGSSTDPSIFYYIYGTWLPQSGYMLANRPHFEILGSKYKNNDPTSEEDIWIPIETPKG